MLWRRIVSCFFYGFVFILLLGASAAPPGDQLDKIRTFTRQIEFNYVGWMLQASEVKLSQSASRAALYLPPKAQKQLVLDYFDLIRKYEQADTQLTDIFADPAIPNPWEASSDVRSNITEINLQIEKVAPIAEGIFEIQLSTLAADEGITFGGQPIPPISYHVSPIPSSLIVSPRKIIRQDANISLKTDLTTDQKVALENKVDNALNVSSLVVPIGGIGIYPTMVMQTTDINWMAEVVAHEWTHNYLTLRPLGINYETNPELRTMNETAASISGKELGKLMIETYYPEFLPPPSSEKTSSNPEPTSPQPVFNFNHEMHLTRIQVDKLLAEGKIAEAEAYMNQQRILFWEHGYHIRKLNQAYFAFYGAYADETQGAAGEDPVGNAVRQLRSQSPSLADFLNRISWMWSSQQLMEAVHG